MNNKKQVIVMKGASMGKSELLENIINDINNDIYYDSIKYLIDNKIFNTNLNIDKNCCLYIDSKIFKEIYFDSVLFTEVEYYNIHINIIQSSCYCSSGNKFFLDKKIKSLTHHESIILKIEKYVNYLKLQKQLIEKTYKKEKLKKL